VLPAEFHSPWAACYYDTSQNSADGQSQPTRDRSNNSSWLTASDLSDVYTCVPVLRTGIAYMYAIPVRNTCLQFVYTCVPVSHVWHTCMRYMLQLCLHVRTCTAYRYLRTCMRYVYAIPVRTCEHRFSVLRQLRISASPMTLCSCCSRAQSAEMSCVDATC